jgi:hypothetical protein
VSDRVLVDEDGDRSAQRLFGAPDDHSAIFVVDSRRRVVFKAEMAVPAGTGETLGALLSGAEPPRLRQRVPLTGHLGGNR